MMDDPTAHLISQIEEMRASIADTTVLIRQAIDKLNRQQRVIDAANDVIAWADDKWGGDSLPGPVRDLWLALRMLKGDW